MEISIKKISHRNFYKKHHGFIIFFYIIFTILYLSKRLGASFLKKIFDPI